MAMHKFGKTRRNNYGTKSLHMTKTIPTSNWRSIRAQRHLLATGLQERHTLRWHSFWIGLLTLLAMGLAMGLASILLKHNWPDGMLGIRYALVLCIGYGMYLLLIRSWAGYMSRRGSSDSSANDIPTPDFPLGSGSSDAGASPVPFESGGGGDFLGGGAQASFDAPSVAGEASGKLLSGAAEVAGAADEGAVVVVPVVAVFAMLLLAFTGASLLVSLLFGIDVLLAVTVELALAVTAGRTAYRVAAEHWLNVAVELTWKPMLGVVLCAMAFGFLADYYVPHAQSASQAIKLMRW
jgi:hypothetical protein